MEKDDILERLVFSEGVVEAYSRPERECAEAAGDHWSGPVLLERVAYLRKLAHFSEGTASDTIREFGGYSLLLRVLVRSSEAMVDERHALTFVVLEGRATMVSGGTLKNSRATAGDEVRGTAIVDGANRELQRGDVVHLAAGTPYQFFLSGEKSFGCIVARVKEDFEPARSSTPAPSGL